MDFKTYQKKSKTTAIYTFPIIYPALGLAGESGEVCERLKKVIRDGGSYNNPKFLADIKKELGDVLWYISNLAKDLGLDLDEIANENLDKLFSRKKREKLQGNGDNR